jgi:calcium channel MID1
MLEWRCPRKGISAEKSYGVGFIDREGDDVSGGGKEGAGIVGRSQDGFGNVWCNGIV